MGKSTRTPVSVPQQSLFWDVKSDLDILEENLLWLSNNWMFRGDRLRTHPNKELQKRAAQYADIQNRTLTRAKQYIFRDRENLMKFHDFILSLKLEEGVFVTFFKLYSSFLPHLEVTATMKLRPGHDWVEIATRILNGEL